MRSLRRAGLILPAGLVGVLLAGGCSSSSGPRNSHAWVPLISRSWGVGAGGEVDKCHGVRATTDLYITGLRPVAPTGQFREYVLVSDSTQPAGDFDCTLSTGLTNSRLIYAAGIGTDSLLFPTGIGEHVRAGQYLILNVHLANVTADSLNGTSTVEYRTGSAADVTTEADMTLAGTLQISIPASGTDVVQAGRCATPDAMQVIAIQPEMNRFGVSQQVSFKQGGGTSTTLHNAPYDVTHQRYDVLAAPVTVPAADSLIVSCTYINGSGSTVSFGESSQTDEQCFAAIVRYPAPSVGSVFGCVTL